MSEINTLSQLEALARRVNADAIQLRKSTEAAARLVEVYAFNNRSRRSVVSRQDGATIVYGTLHGFSEIEVVERAKQYLAAGADYNEQHQLAASIAGGNSI